VQDVISISYACTRILGFNGSHEPARSSKMAHDLLPGSDTYRGVRYGSHDGSHLEGYRVGHGHVQTGRGRSALNRVNSYMRNLIEAAANAKLRRMRRELEVRGLRLDQCDGARIAVPVCNDNRSEQAGPHMAAILASASVLRSATGSVLTFMFPSWHGPARKYRPEDHYMRGPGPKWRAKHLSDRAQVG
jgi:hypothetical protein